MSSKEFDKAVEALEQLSYNELFTIAMGIHGGSIKPKTPLIFDITKVGKDKTNAE